MGQPPTTGALWTPGDWGYGYGGYFWNAGYWGPYVGYYGGINYGFGYFGIGFYGDTGGAAAPVQPLLLQPRPRLNYDNVIAVPIGLQRTRRCASFTRTSYDDDRGGRYGNSRAYTGYRGSGINSRTPTTPRATVAQPTPPEQRPRRPRAYNGTSNYGNANNGTRRFSGSTNGAGDYSRRSAEPGQ